MTAYFNGNWIENDIELPLNDRALQFGDGLFETIIVYNGTIRFLERHYNRIHKGTTTLGLQPLKLSMEDLSQVIHELIKINGSHQNARVKLQVWRHPSSTAGYKPASTNTNVLITVAAHAPFEKRITKKVSYSSTVTLSCSAISRFKTMSALPYVMASYEAVERGLDDLILLDGKGRVSECIMSNLFWIKDDTIFTPHLSTGCIEGIMRGHLMDKYYQTPLNIVESEAMPEALDQADAIFSANVAGFYPIENLDSRKLNINHPFIQTLIAQEALHV